MQKYKCKIFFLFLLFLLTIGMGGCTTPGLRGKAHADRELLNSFRNYQLNATYSYYLYSAGNNYYALLGLNPQYTVPIYKMWKFMDIDDPEMKTISLFLWEKSPFYEGMGYHLINSSGQIIGEVYTSAIFNYVIEKDYSLTFYFDTPWFRENGMF